MADLSGFVSNYLSTLNSSDRQTYCRMLDKLSNDLRRQLKLATSNYQQLSASVAALQEQELKITDQLSDVNSSLNRLNASPLLALSPELQLMKTTLISSQNLYQSMILQTGVRDAEIRQQQLAGQIRAIKEELLVVNRYKNGIAFRLGGC